MKPGTYVRRAVYAKLQAENHRLMRVIKVMACGETMDAIRMRLKWRKKFKEDEDFWKIVKVAAAEYAKEHPELIIKRKENVKGK